MESRQAVYKQLAELDRYKLSEKEAAEAAVSMQTGNRETAKRASRQLTADRKRQKLDEQTATESKHIPGTRRERDIWREPDRDMPAKNVTQNSRHTQGAGGKSASFSIYYPV